MTPSSGGVRHHDLIVLGAGPGGLQMARELDRADRDYLVLEREATAGNFFATFPRHRRLISLNKRENWFPEDEFNQRHDWNSLLSDDPDLRFGNYSSELYPEADDLLRYLSDYAERLGLNIRYSTEVSRVSRDGERFRLVTTEGDGYSCRTLICALGVVRPRIPDIEGIEHAVGYEDMPLDPEFYRGKRVGIIGQGNSAFETANHLASTAAFVHILGKDPIKMAWDTHFTGDLRAVNNDMFDLFQLKTMHAVLVPRLERIRRVGDIIRTNHSYDYPTAPIPGTVELTRDYDVMIRCTGWEYVPVDLFDDDCRPAPQPDGKFPAMTPAWESVNVPGLYFAGVAMAGNDRQATSGFIHGFRYDIRTLGRILAERDGLEPMATSGAFDWASFSAELPRPTEHHGGPLRAVRQAVRRRRRRTRPGLGHHVARATRRHGG